MATIKMDRTKTNKNDGGAWYHTYITTSGTSAIYEIPDVPIYAIGCGLDTVMGSGSMWFSDDSPAKLADASATFEEWNGTSEINLSVTGFKLVATSGILTGHVMVKSSRAS